MNTYEKRARERSKLLWDFYYANAEKITTGDCYRLLDTKNLKSMLDQCRKYRIQIPPRWGEPRVRVKRQAKKLNDMAAKKGADELTTIEMAQALGIPKNQVYRARQDCQRYGYDIPKLKIEQEWRREMIIKKNAEKKSGMIMIDEDVEMQSEYLEGLPIVESLTRINPDNPEQVIYMLR